MLCVTPGSPPPGFPPPGGPLRPLLLLLLPARSRAWRRARALLPSKTPRRKGKILTIDSLCLSVPTPFCLSRFPKKRPRSLTDWTLLRLLVSLRRKQGERARERGEIESCTYATIQREKETINQTIKQERGRSTLRRSKRSRHVRTYECECITFRVSCHASWISSFTFRQGRGGRSPARPAYPAHAKHFIYVYQFDKMCKTNGRIHCMRQNELKRTHCCQAEPSGRWDLR